MTEHNGKGIRPAVAVIGAGPAGLYAARTLAAGGLHVALINRDIKLGGLAEYGIFHNKHKMKNGLRKQFRTLMEDEAIHYFGNVAVGGEGALSLDDLRRMGFAAILVTVGAQGTKWLGLEGEDLMGVYHAKDIVYHYNQLPPFAGQSFPIGRRAALVGVGNVMIDIANYCIHDLKLDEVTAVARRSPADVKFTKKEMGLVGANLDLAHLDAEIQRATPAMLATGQDPEAAKAFILEAVEKAEPKDSETVFRLDFLASPARILGEGGQVTGLEVEDTTLEPRPGGGESKSVGLGTRRVLACDTVVFCIGDRVDPAFGLPLDKWQEFAKHPRPRYPVEGNSYEAYDPQADRAVEGVFVAGWAREASSGLVGTARKDGENGAEAVLAYLAEHPAPAADPLGALEARLNAAGLPVVRKADWRRLEEIEARLAAARGLALFKFPSNAEMLTALGFIQGEQA
jgi:ferredoxin--NADP+ reductase